MAQTKELSFQDKVLEGIDSRKILLVDDEPDTLMLTSFTLTRAGFNIVLAENGQQALEKYEQEKPVMVILDRMMPEMDGIEVCRQLRTLDPNLYIMILTALDTDSDRITGWEAGADDYVGKPINFKELVLRVKARMRRIDNEDGTLSATPAQTPSTRVMSTKVESPTVASLSITEPSQSELDKVDLEKAAATDNRQVQSYLLRASRAAQAYEIDRAHELYLQALDIEPNNPVALKWLAYHTSNPHEGCEYLEKLVIVQPDNVKARRLLEIGRQRCRELDQQAFSNILSYMNPVAEPVAVTAPAAKARTTVSAPPKPTTQPKRPIGELLIEKGYITRENIETAANLQQMFQQAGAPKKLGEILVDYGVLTEEQLKRVLAEQNAPV